ncbi:MAG: hypothetical protein GY757_54740, partial [bacterium]|nr:hypothetical protein [bacterium]
EKHRKWILAKRPAITTGITFDGYRWRRHKIKPGAPLVSFLPTASGAGVTQLNASGQFPFDTVKSFGKQQANLWITYENGFARYASEKYNRHEFIPEHYHHWPWLKEEKWKVQLVEDPARKIWMGLTLPGKYRVSVVAPEKREEKRICPFRLSTGEEDRLNPFLDRKWIGKMEGDNLEIRLKTGGKTVEITRTGKDKTSHLLALPGKEKILGIEWPGGPQAWLLTKKGVYTLHLRRLKRSSGNTAKAETAEPLFREPYWTDYIDQGKDDWRKWEEMGHLFKNIEERVMSDGAYTTAKLLKWEGVKQPTGGNPENPVKLMKRINITDYDWIGTRPAGRAKRRAEIYGKDSVKEWKLSWYLYDMAAKLETAKIGKPSGWLGPLLGVTKQITRLDKNNPQQWQILAGIHLRFGEKYRKQADNCLTVIHLLSPKQKCLRRSQGNGGIKKSPPGRRRQGDAAAIIKDVNIKNDRWIGKLGKVALNRRLYRAGGKYVYIPWNLFSLAIEVKGDREEWWQGLYKIVKAEKGKKERWDKLARVYRRENRSRLCKGAETVSWLLRDGDYATPGYAIEVIRKINITDAAWTGKLAKAAEEKGNRQIAWNLYLRAASIQRQGKGKWLKRLISLIKREDFRNHRRKWGELGNVWKAEGNGCKTISYLLGNRGAAYHEDT